MLGVFGNSRLQADIPEAENRKWSMCGKRRRMTLVSQREDVDLAQGAFVGETK